MREIKFRGLYHFKKNALYPEVKRWVYGYLYMEGDVAFIKDGKHHYKVHSDSVGQFTGKLDKNGAKIYEGHIIIWPHMGNDEKHRVEWSEKDCAWVTNEGDKKTTSWLDSTCVIIGSDHTNPELVKT